tara:strand:- start:659 stop:916 length:258 start_codon:yes stop_codon:yes gene_type:complete
MIVHGIDMMKVNQPEYAKAYEKKMMELLPEWEQYYSDPFGRNLVVKKTKKPVFGKHTIVYMAKSLMNKKDWKVDEDGMWRVEVNV